MTDDAILEVLRQVVYVCIVLSLPALGVALVVGLVIGLLQAITSIQEQTLSFVPKLIAMGVVLIALGPWMLRVLGGYTAELLAALPRFAAM